jgi:hypothetical protein
MSKELKDYIRKNYSDSSQVASILKAYSESSIIISGEKIIFSTGLGHLSECKAVQKSNELMIDCSDSLVKRSNIKCGISNNNLVCKAATLANEPEYVYSKEKQNMEDWWGDLLSASNDVSEKSKENKGRNNSLSLSPEGRNNQNNFSAIADNVNQDSWKKEYITIKNLLFSLEETCAENNDISQSIYHYKNPIFWTVNDQITAKRIISDISRDFLNQANIRINLMNTLKKFKNNPAISDQEALKRQNAFVSNKCIEGISEFKDKSNLFLVKQSGS